MFALADGLKDLLRQPVQILQGLLILWRSEEVVMAEPADVCLVPRVDTAALGCQADRVNLVETKKFGPAEATCYLAKGAKSTIA